MKAMILAAGFGTRLRPLTNDRPKALVEVAGRTLLEVALCRLRAFGIRDVIINVHHFADVEYLKANGQLGMRIEISREDDLLDTGGGLKKAAYFFRAESPDEPFILHNVDVFSAIDLAKMTEFHRACGGLATLAVQQRKTSRYLLFDEQLQLCGRRTAEKGDEMARPASRTQAWAFSGIHVLSPRIFTLMDEGGRPEQQAFPIVPEYLRLAGEGQKIVGFQADAYYWRDVGTPESLRKAAEELEQMVLEQ
jgi:NDP-sugar pyrophosphorylase family protein